MSETTHTPGLPRELEFDIENHGVSHKPGFGIVIVADGRSSHIHIEGWEDDAIALAREVVRRWNAHDDLVAALKIMHDCGEPYKVSLYDEEGIEGWRWTHSDGREWTEMGSWNEDAPMHPVAEAALAKAGEK